MANGIVIGGGFAGLSSSVFLTNHGHKIKLIEASPKLGGRAYSFKYETQNCTVDNGQHILMGCYLFTKEFLEMIDSLDAIEIQPYLKINFVARGGKKYQLNTEGVTYPFNILSALKNYNALTNIEKFGVVKLFLRIAICNPKHYSDITTAEFLKRNNQSKNSIDALWNIIHVGTMNCKLSESSAEIFLRVMKEIFFTVDESTRVILSKKGLSEIYCEQSVDFLNKRGSSISLSEKLITIEFDSERNKATSITTSKQKYVDFDFIVLAIPPSQVAKLFNVSSVSIDLPKFEYSSILNIHLWLDKNPFKEKFYGLIDSKIHWLFNHGDHLTLVTSSADELIELDNKEIYNIVKEELLNFFDEFKSAVMLDYLVIKEKQATFKPSIVNSEWRKNFSNKFGNIYFTGDWTNTGFPATIEGAVKSSALAVDIVSENLKIK